MTPNVITLYFGVLLVSPIKTYDSDSGLVVDVRSAHMEKDNRSNDNG